MTTIDLGPGRHQASLSTFRMFVDTPGSEFFDIAVRTPKGMTIQLQVRHQNAYIVGFKGASAWYSLL